MTLGEYLEQMTPDAEIGLCNESSFHYELDGKIYDAFYVGKAADVPTETLKRTVVNSFEAFMWNRKTFILQE